MIHVIYVSDLSHHLENYLRKEKKVKKKERGSTDIINHKIVFKF